MICIYQLFFLYLHKQNISCLVFGDLGLACEGQPYFFICQQRIGFDYLLEQPRSSSLPCLYLNQINIQWKSHGAASPHPHITGLTKFYLNQIIIHPRKHGKSLTLLPINFYLNQIIICQTGDTHKMGNLWLYCL